MSIATAQESKRSGRDGKDKALPASEVPVPGQSIAPPPRLRRRPALVAALGRGDLPGRAARRVGLYVDEHLPRNPRGAEHDPPRRGHHP